jgi:hypothetical protein
MPAGHGQIRTADLLIRKPVTYERRDQLKLLMLNKFRNLQETAKLAK